MEKTKNVSNHSLDDLKRYHNEAVQFFAAELMLLKKVIPAIKGDKLAKTATLLISCGQTGAALLQLATQTDSFTAQSAMLARAFMETITNFCYVNICDEKEYRAFLLHPVYKGYHNISLPGLEDSSDLESIEKNSLVRKNKQDKLKELPIVQEALSIFSETKDNMNWTNKKLYERIEALQKWGKFLDVFFTLSKMQYYSDASEALHGSLYGCTYHLGVLDPAFDLSKENELDKKLNKDSTCMLLHLGLLIHQSFTLISYSCDIKEIWNHSYDNQRLALNLLFHVIEKKHRACK